MTSRIVAHPTLSNFLSTVTSQAQDNNRLNLTLGPLIEIWTKETEDGEDFVKNAGKPDSKTRIFITLWEGDSLRLLFTKFGSGQSRIATPVPPSQFDALVIPHLHSLVTHLLTLPIFSTIPASFTGPALLRTLTGPRPLVLPFLSLWPHPHSTLPGLDIHACSLRSSPQSSAPLPEGHSVSLVDFNNLSTTDLHHIAQLVIGFISNHPSSTSEMTLEQAKERARNMAPMWIYKAPPLDDQDQNSIPVGFVHLGRSTPKTLAIRGVMVSPMARGRGVAERMVSNVARTYLVDAPAQEWDSSFNGMPPKPDLLTVFGRKEEVCLFVEVTNETARRLYKRIGFEESEDRWGNWDLTGVEAGSW